jgi:hypothetical protein
MNYSIKLTRASFDEQKTAYCVLFDGILVVGESVEQLPGNTDDEFKSCVPSVDRFALVSRKYNTHNWFF